jgi:tRNA nucleotidyltransferase (CCA-adding enzyme)
LAAELNFQLAASTSAFVQRHGALLSQVSAERVLAELEKLARCPLGAQGLRQAIELGLLQPWLEELALDNLQPLNDAGPLSAAEASTALPLARFAQLFGASGLGRLRASKRLQQRCSILRKWLRILATSPSLGEEQQLLLCQELELDLAALVLLAPQQTKGWLERWRNPKDCLFHPRSPIDGDQLQRELGIKPGPALGLLLAQLTRARAFGRPHNLEAARILAEQRPPAA